MRKLIGSALCGVLLTALYIAPLSGAFAAQTRDDRFAVPNGTLLVAVLNEDLSTKDALDDDRVTLLVRSPARYRGATIEGRVLQTKRSGRVTGRSGLTLDFNRIRLRNGRSYEFAGLIDSVTTRGGEKVRVDREGGVEEGDNRTETTAKRSGIGAAAGAVIGAIAGGGKGAAIGAAVGAGTGAGSVYVQGRDDLELRSGSRITIRASSPR